MNRDEKQPLFRYHRHLVDEVVNTLQATFFSDSYASKLVEKNLKNQKKWGSRDRRFYAENVYECVRWWRKLWFVLGLEPSNDKVEILQAWAVYNKMADRPLPDWHELRGIEFKSSRVTGAPFEIQESIPDWLDKLGRRELKDRWPAIMKSMNHKASVDLRVNTLKTVRQELQQRLREEGIETKLIDSSEVGLTLIERKNVFITKAYREGLFEVQDRASQQIALLLNPQPGERVVDACAGAGGKTLHLAARMNNKGKIISLDIHQRKLDELMVRARRGGVSIVEPRLIESTKVIKRLVDSADKLLLDVPCSGMGTLRRSPDIKWKLHQAELDNLRLVQKDILQNYSRILRIGGLMVYATCSILPSENEVQVADFLAENPGWELVQELRIDPDQNLGDGFYAALIKRLS